jgi:hypothetical protein
MAGQRFPHRKYLRQLRDMREDLLAWSEVWRAAGREEPDLATAYRYASRAEVVDDVQAKLLDAFLVLEELPRVT